MMEQPQMQSTRQASVHGTVLSEAHQGIVHELSSVFVCLQNDVEAMVAPMRELGQDLDKRIALQHKRIAQIEAEKRRCAALFGQLQGMFQHSPDPAFASEEARLAPDADDFATQANTPPANTTRANGTSQSSSRSSVVNVSAPGSRDASVSPVPMMA